MIWKIGSLLTVLLFAANSAQAIEIKEIETPLGIRAWLAEDHAIPFTAINILFSRGAAYEPVGKAGATYLMSGLLGEGAGEYDAVEFEKLVNSTGAQISFDAYTETFSVSAQLITETRDSAAELLKLALLEPRFDEDAFDRVRNQVYAILENVAQDPNDKANDELSILFFDDHPYARPREGNRKSVSELTIEDMRLIHRNTLVRKSIVIGAAGDITADELAIFLDTLLGDLPETSTSSLDTTVVRVNEERVYRIDHPSPQSVVTFGHEGLLRDDHDYLAAYVLNEILGGSGLNSRLNMELREKRGLTYGVGTYLYPRSEAGLIVGGFSTVNESVDEAIDTVVYEWNRIANDGVSQEELQTAKTYLKGAYPLRFDGNAKIASIFSGMMYSGLPASYVNERNNMIEDLTVQSINNLAKKIYKPNELTFVVVGPTVN